MKKLWIIVIVFMFVAAMVAWSQVIYEANQITVGWVAPEFLVDGNPIPSEDVLAYNVFIRPNGSQDIPDPLDTVYELTYVITVPDGVFEAGVSALRYIGGAGSPYESEILWSLEADPPFLLRNGRPTGVVTNFRVIE